jgi:ubiquinone/menaquinone biosynthesis C-methylase UbiE
MIDIQTLYSQRFHEAGLERRRRVWRVLCDEFFSRLVEPNDSVLDLACGYGEFINAVQAKQRIGIDLNPDAARFLDSAVRFYQAAATDLSEISISGIDVVFTSNFLEHLSSKEQCSEVFQQVHRVLKPEGRFIILGPNIRYAYREYWNYFDHQIALSDLAVVEGLQQTGFRMQRVIPRFLPFTMQHSLPTNDALVRLYLKLPLVWRVFGKQFLVVASKSE